MSIYSTPFGYQVRETINGLDVTENGRFIGELRGKTLNDYRIDKDDDMSDIDDDALDDDIKELEDFNEMLANC
jgi:hypothetical protein